MMRYPEATPRTLAATTSTRDSGHWTERAECNRRDRHGARVHDPELWFPIGTSDEAGKRPKAICANTCSVRETCLDWALTTGLSDGIAGGLDHLERRALARRTRRAVDRAESRPPSDIGLSRRLQALACAGWTMTALADIAFDLLQIEVSRATLINVLGDLCAGRGARTNAPTPHIVAALWGHLADDPPTGEDPGGACAHARVRAARNGWLPVEAWNGRDIDDPSDTTGTTDMTGEQPAPADPTVVAA